MLDNDFPPASRVGDRTCRRRQGRGSQTEEFAGSDGAVQVDVQVTRARDAHAGNTWEGQEARRQLFSDFSRRLAQGFRQLEAGSQRDVAQFQRGRGVEKRGLYLQLEDLAHHFNEPVLYSALDG
jgi:hypothetical protein